jgi:hypothetical protein
MKALELFEEKQENLIRFLSDQTFVGKDPELAKNLTSFRDTRWNLEYCLLIEKSWTEEKTKRRQILENLIRKCNIDPNRFRKDEIEKLERYLDFFVSLTKKCKSEFEKVLKK